MSRKVYVIEVGFIKGRLSSFEFRVTIQVNEETADVLLVIGVYHVCESAIYIVITITSNKKHFLKM